MIAEYVYFGLRPVAVKNGSNINIVHTDYLTTPRIVTSGGSIVWQWRNDNPYGNNLAQGNIEFNLRFAGQYYDAESGLHYNIHRTYNPEIGRYMQSDPLGLSAGSNTYNYVGRNPFDAVDPDGKVAILIPIIGGVAGGVANGLNYYSQGYNFWKGFSIGAVVGVGSTFIPSAAIGGAVGGAGTQLLNRIYGVKLFDTGSPVKDCAYEVLFTAGIGAFLGHNFDKLADGITMSSINTYIKKNSEIVKTAIANGYTMYYSNLMNAYTNISGVIH